MSTNLANGRFRPAMDFQPWRGTKSEHIQVNTSPTNNEISVEKRRLRAGGIYERGSASVPAIVTLGHNRTQKNTVLEHILSPLIFNSLKLIPNEMHSGCQNWSTPHLPPFAVHRPAATLPRISWPTALLQGLQHSWGSDAQRRPAISSLAPSQPTPSPRVCQEAAKSSNRNQVPEAEWIGETKRAVKWNRKLSN